MGNLVWQNWSRFGKPDISIADTNVSNETVNLNYDDTWGFALGGAVRVRGRLAVVVRRRLRQLAGVKGRALADFAHG